MMSFIRVPYKGVVYPIKEYVIHIYNELFTCNHNDIYIYILKMVPPKNAQEPTITSEIVDYFTPPPPSPPPPPLTVTLR